MAIPLETLNPNLPANRLYEFQPMLEYHTHSIWKNAFTQHGLYVPLAHISRLVKNVKIPYNDLKIGDTGSGINNNVIQKLPICLIFTK